MTRIAIVDKSKCNSIGCGGYLCIRICPINRSQQECIVKAENNKVKINEPLCSGCGLCSKKCPFKAIDIINLPSELNETPVHRYGKNAFELFRLPTPQPGQVVGLLGANGIGKTTALNILAGHLRPNLGNYDGNVEDKEIINFFKGSELQKYFQQLLDKKVAFSYKTQYIDNINDIFTGTVFELLQKFGSKTNAIEIAQKFGIDKILNRDVKHISGGELQKTMIAASVLKPAEVYYMDEPASYLDIKERAKVAKLLRELVSGTNKSMITVEHDLIILDYLADLIHILFGKESAYGVVSHPLSAKAGINTYLDGYLNDENLRFRPEPLKFSTGTKDSVSGRAIYINWPLLQKKLGTFNLEIQPSELYTKEVVGIVGANGIGKTTFMKLLAGIIQPDNGKIEKTIKISYKPQYTKAQEGVTVMGALLAVSKEVLSQNFKLDVITPLQLDNLMDKNLNELSGGELQRVAIAACLARKADVILMDEPTTYLDIEQRLQVAKAIRKIVVNKDISALVIDHDLMFVAHIADRIMVFDGEPAVEGKANKIRDVKSGLNDFLKDLNITLRKDAETGRPRVNKLESVKDKLQKAKGEYFYT